MAGRRILVVDDDDDFRELIAEVLADERHAVATATNGLQALDMLRDADPLPDLVLLDLVMPELDGCGFIAEARNNKRLSKLRVIMLSASQDDVPRVSVYGRLRKPFAVEELLTLIEQA